jgi:hypothetical protein
MDGLPQATRAAALAVRVCTWLRDEETACVAESRPKVLSRAAPLRGAALGRHPVGAHLRQTATADQHSSLRHSQCWTRRPSPAPIVQLAGTASTLPCGRRCTIASHVNHLGHLDVLQPLKQTDQLVLKVPLFSQKKTEEEKQEERRAKAE